MGPVGLFSEHSLFPLKVLFLNDRKDAKNQQGTEQVAPHLQRETYLGVFAFCVICMRIYILLYRVRALVAGLRDWLTAAQGVFTDSDFKAA